MHSRFKLKDCQVPVCVLNAEPTLISEWNLPCFVINHSKNGAVSSDYEDDIRGLKHMNGNTGSMIKGRIGCLYKRAFSFLQKYNVFRYGMETYALESCELLRGVKEKLLSR